MAEATIKRGVDALLAYGAKSTADMNSSGKLAAMAGLSTTISTICDLQVEAKQVRDRLVFIHKDVFSEIEKRTEQIKKNHNAMGYIARENGPGRIDTMGSEKRVELQQAAIHRMRKEVLGTPNEEVEELRGKIAGHRAMWQMLKEAWASPLVVLNRTTFKSEGRATAAQNLVGAGAYAVDLAAAEAIRTGDAGLGAAVCVAIDHLSKSEQNSLRYSKNEIASSLTHKDFTAAHEALQMSKYFLDAADLSTDEITGEPVTPEDRIRVGMVKRTVAEDIGKPEDQLDIGPEDKRQKGQAKPGKFSEANAVIVERLDRELIG